MDPAYWKKVDCTLRWVKSRLTKKEAGPLLSTDEEYAHVLSIIRFSDQVPDAIYRKLWNIVTKTLELNRFNDIPIALWEEYFGEEANGLTQLIAWAIYDNKNEDLERVLAPFPNEMAFKLRHEFEAAVEVTIADYKYTEQGAREKEIGGDIFEQSQTHMEERGKKFLQIMQGKLQNAMQERLKAHAKTR